jgi:hypothetical protein
MLWASNRADRVDKSFIRWIAVPSRGHRGLQNHLNFQTFWLLDPESE